MALFNDASALVAANDGWLVVVSDGQLAVAIRDDAVLVVFDGDGGDAPLATYQSTSL